MVNIILLTGQMTCVSYMVNMTNDLCILYGKYYLVNRNSSQPRILREMYSGPSQTFRMETFAKVVNGI